jgi:hypothetical protein
VGPTSQLELPRPKILVPAHVADQIARQAAQAASTPPEPVAAQPNRATRRRIAQDAARRARQSRRRLNGAQSRIEQAKGAM